MSNEELQKLVLEWANDKKMIDPANLKSQYMKLAEEVGELSAAINKNLPKELEDTIGDIQVVMIILAAQAGYDYNKSLETAYNVIKNRHGKMIDGTFVKDEDLANEVY